MAEQSKYSEPVETESVEKSETDSKIDAGLAPNSEELSSDPSRGPNDYSNKIQSGESWLAAFWAGLTNGARNGLRLLTWSRGGTNGVLFTMALVTFVLALVFGFSPKAPLSTCANSSGIPGNWLSAIEQDCFLRMHQDFGNVLDTFHREDQLWVVSEYGVYQSGDDGRSWSQDPFANELLTHVDYGEWGIKAFSSSWVYSLAADSNEWQRQRLKEIPSNPEFQQAQQDISPKIQQQSLAAEPVPVRPQSVEKRNLKELYGAPEQNVAQTTNAPARSVQQAFQLKEPLDTYGKGIDDRALDFPQAQIQQGAVSGLEPLPQAEGSLSQAEGSLSQQAEGSLSQQAEGSQIAAVSFISPSTGLAVQSGGRILRTEDGGVSWRFAQSSDNTVSNHILFVDAQYAVSVGDAGLLRVSRDGGRNWTRRPLAGENAGGDLYKALFVDAEKGWLIGSNGGLWHTPDAGGNWIFTRLSSNGEDELVSDLVGIYFRNAFEGWVSAANGDLFFTSDGGDNWQLLDAELTQPLRLLANNTGGRLWGISGDSELRVSSNLGDSWQLQLLGATTSVVDFVDASLGWRAVLGEGIYRSEDGGLNWHLQLSDGEIVWLNFISALQGFALAADGRLLVTADAGENWNSVSVSIVEWLSELGFRPGLGINAVPMERILATSGGVLESEYANSNESLRAENLDFLDPRSADSFQRRLDLVEEADAIFNGPFDEICNPCTAGYFLQPETAWLGDAQGRIWYTVDAGATWVEQKNSMGQQASGFAIKDILFVDAGRGWAITDSTVLRTNDAGITWIEDPVSSPFPKFGPVIEGTPRIIAGNQQMFDWDSGDKKWQPLFQYQLWPSPASFVFSVIAGLSLILLIVRIRNADLERSKTLISAGVKSIVKSSVALAGKSESDAPIDSLDKDRLGTGSLAVSLFKFIHNKNTSTPLNIAVTGAWGKGKSSVMGMLADLLRQHDYRTIWFNAWHYRSEETFLGAFLQTIEMEALPPWYTLRGMLLRYKLGIKRMGKFFTFTALMLVLLMAGLLHSAASEHVECQTQHIQWTLCQQRIETLSAQLWEDMIKLPEDTIMAGTMSVMAGSGVLGLLWALVKSFSIFGWLRGSKELAFWRDQFSLTEFKADPGMRYRIEKVLEDLSGVLGKRPLIIFFDDVDRCPPERQLQVMETINFLSSHNRNGVYLIGAALDIVVPSLATAFNTIVKEKIEPKLEDESSDAYNSRLARARQDYARDYMRKMVTLEVSVPTRVEVTSVSEMDEKGENASVRSAKYSRAGTEVTGLNRFLQLADTVLLPVMLCVMTLTAAFWFWDSAGTVAGKTSTVFASSTLPGEQPTAAGSTGRSSAFPAPFDPAVPAGVDQPGTDGGGDTASFSSDLTAASAAQINPFARVNMVGISPDLNYSVFIPLSLGIVFLFAFLITRQDKIQADDSKEFISAEKIWRQVLQFHNQTEREYKRTLNLLRLLVARMETRFTSEVDTAHSFVVLMALYLGIRGFYHHDSAEIVNEKMDGFLKISRNRELGEEERQELKGLLLPVVDQQDPIAAQSIDRFVECWIQATKTDEMFNDTVLPSADNCKREFFQFMSEVVLH